MAIYLMSDIKHLFDKNDSLLMLFDEDGIADARRNLSIGTLTIPPRIDINLEPYGVKMDKLINHLLDEFNKYKEEPYESDKPTKTSLKGIRNQPDREDYRRMLGVIICNMLIQGKDKYIRIPQGHDTIFEPKYNRYNPSLLKINKVTNLIHFLALNDYIDFYINTRQSKFESRFMIKDKLHKLFRMYNLSDKDIIINKNIEVIILKKKINKGNRVITVLSDYDDSEEIKSRREILHEYNDILTDWKERINFKNPMPNILYAKCIYNDNLSRGGRIYAPWQNLSEESRSKITIDGSSIVEVDLKSCSLRIACHLLDISVEKVDLYDVGNYTRKDVKLVVQQMLNMKDNSRTLFQYINDISSSFELLNSISNTDKEYIKELVSKVYDYYNTSEMKKLSSVLFFKDKGMRDIIHIESKISFSVIKEFIDEGEIVLGIHDSFIVRSELEGKLVNSIYDNYRKLLNHEPILTIDDEVVVVASYY